MFDELKKYEINFDMAESLLQEGYQILRFDEEDAKFDLETEGLNCKDHTGLNRFAVICAGDDKKHGWKKVLTYRFNSIIFILFISLLDTKLNQFSLLQLYI